MPMTTSTRRLRAFKRWMKSQEIQYSSNLQFIDGNEEGIAVKALCNLKEGDAVAKIPKLACLTIKTSAACSIIKDATLDGSLGLSVALMYEKSLGEDSPWSGYLQLLPDKELLPFLWTPGEVEQLLQGTELHKTVEEDKILMYEDWKESILPLIDALPMELNLKHFGVEQYFAAKSLIASRSFMVDDYHGFGMVPLADLFNHKTCAEDVHITSVSSHIDFDNSPTSNSDVFHDNDDKSDGEQTWQNFTGLDSALAGKESDNDLDVSISGDDPTILEMIMVKDVKVGREIFNTYGSLGNAALLHRYGFTEPNNPYDIVNIDLELVLQWSSSLFSSRYSRARLSLWRRLDYCACESENSEYFEISYNGDPQIELLILLYIMLLPEDAYHKLDITVSTAGSYSGPNTGIMFCEKSNIMWTSASEMSRDLLLTKSVCKALVSLADIRESLYGSSSLEDDVKALGNCGKQEKKLYHSLMLRVSERTILKKLSHAATGNQSFRTAKRASRR